MTDDLDKLQTIRAQIAREEQVLAELDRERAQIEERLTRLKAVQNRLAARGPLSGGTDDEFRARSDAAPTKPQEKLALFRELFAGRQDIFPLKFVSKKTGKTGYAPACKNKFVPGVCGLPQVKCGECPNQAFLPVNDGVLLGHLQGRHIIGVYPLLENETCWFLAADFDKASWREEVAAFRATCKAEGVPCAVERSQSGNGAHVWFFFSSPVTATLARQMGCYLLTATMSVRHQLSMASYDRLFPSQDTLPRGGFGNLIALPLQYRSRSRGNTLFIDEDFEPYSDQWAYLASLTRISAVTIQSIALRAERERRVIDVPSPESDAGHEDTPWRRPPSGWRDLGRVVGPMPAKVNAVLAQRVFIDAQGLPSALLNRIKRLAAFQNPEFYKKQRMRLSTALTPRVIARAEEVGHYIAVPRGCLAAVNMLFADNGIELTVRDDRLAGEAIDVTFKGELTALQQQSADSLLCEDMGILVAPPGFGKTVVAAYLIAKRRCSTLVLVHRQPLMEQWVARLASFLGVDEKDIGRLGGGRKRPNGRLDVATIQSVVRKDRVADLVAEYGQVIVDECHHVPAVSFEHVLSEIKARHVVGLTATPRRRDGLHPILEMQLGPQRFTVDAQNQALERPFDHHVIARTTAFRLPDGWEKAGIQDIYRQLASDAARNDLILNDVIAAVDEGRSPLLLTERKDHLSFLAKHLSGFVRHLVIFQGGMGKRARKALTDQLANIPNQEERLILATGRYVGEGFDDRRLDTLFLTMPVAWRGVVTQYAGRLHRLNGSKRDVRIHDYVDGHVPVLERMFAKRLRAYRAMGYIVRDTALDAKVTDDNGI
ncbi:MAG TPA: DEAD/DEAH box helicase family protein [Gammaproteobacteria bacterium]|nr:DEAD/DEAH box helicase family protein [Gammaproteobacteria bacterium]